MGIPLWNRIGDALMTQKNKSRVLVVAMILLVSLVSLAVTNVVYTAREVEQAKKQIRIETAKNTRQQCQIIELSTQPRPVPPVPPFAPTTDPQSDYGKDLDVYIKAKDKYDKELEEFNITAGKALRNYSQQIGCGKS